MSSMRTLTAVTIAGSLVFGMMLALLGRLKLALAGRLQRSEGQVQRMLIALNVAAIPLVLLCGLFLDAYGARAILMAGSVALSLGLLTLSLRPVYPHAFASLLLATLGTAGVSVASLVLMPRAFFAADETAASLNLGFAFVALGALMTPALADVLLDALELRRALAIFAFLALVPAILGVFPQAEHWQLLEPEGAGSLLGGQASWWAVLVLFVYAPLEACLSGWTFTLLGERGQKQEEASDLLYGFWAAFLGSRLLVAWAQHESFLTQSWDRWLVVSLPLAAAAVLGNLSGSGQRGRPLTGLVLLGLLLGPVLPTLLGVVFRQIPAGERGLAYGLIFAAGSLGSLVFSPLVALRPQQLPQTVLRLPIVLSLLLTGMALVFSLMTL
jgi:MFS family permease